MKYRTISIKNGDCYEPYRIYSCARCGKDIEEAWPMEEQDDEVYCGDCAFIEGFISEEEYLNNHLFFLIIPGLRAAVRDSKIHLTTSRFPWEKTPKQTRNSKEYTDWRTAVFKRDEYTCAICRQVGGRLNAHHIRPFKDFPSERFNVDNGITLCEECHKRVHKEKSKIWIKDDEND